MAIASQELIELISTLSERQQQAVKEFIHYLKSGKPQAISVDVACALDAFVRDQDELLHRLALAVFSTKENS